MTSEALDHLIVKILNADPKSKEDNLFYELKRIQTTLDGDIHKTGLYLDLIEDEFEGICDAYMESKIGLSLYEYSELANKIMIRLETFKDLPIVAKLTKVMDTWNFEYKGYSQSFAN